MNTPDTLLAANARWAAARREQDPEFFSRLAIAQRPGYLWVGCADSRVPANEVTGLAPGELFVTRNVANLVVHTDLSLLSVLQYSVEVLKVQHVIVCGHYGCGGVRAAMQPTSVGLIDNWLRHIRDVYARHRSELDEIANEDQRFCRLCEHNVVAQAENVASTTIVQAAWRRGQPLEVHGWVYDLEDGRLKDLGVTFKGPEQLKRVYRVG